MKTLILIILILTSTMILSAEIEAEKIIDVCDCAEVKNLSDDIISIFNLGLRTQEDPELALEVDKLILLADLQTLNKQKSTCTHFRKTYFSENQKALNILSSSELHELKLYSEAFDIKEFEPRVLHQYSYSQRTLLFKGTLDGEEVYFKLELAGDGRAKVSYIPIQEKHEKTLQELFEEDQIRSEKDLDKVDQERIKVDLSTSENKDKVKAELSHRSTGEKFGEITATEQGKTVGRFNFNDEQKQDFVSIDMKGDERHSEGNKVGGKYVRKTESYDLRVGGDSEENAHAGITLRHDKYSASLDTNLDSDDKTKMASKIVREGERLKVTLRTENSNESESIGGSINYEINEKIHVEADIEKDLVNNTNTIVTEGEFKSKHGVTIAKAKTVNEELSRAEISVKRNILDFETKTTHSEDFENNKSNTELIVEKGKVKSSSSLNQSEEIVEFNTKLDYTLSENTDLHLSVGGSNQDNKEVEFGARHDLNPKGDQKIKRSVAYSTKIEMQTEQEILNPKIAYIHENVENKSTITSSVESQYGGERVGVKGRVQYDKKLSDGGKIGFYVEGDAIAENYTVGGELKHEFGSDGSDVRLIKKHKLIKIIIRNDVFVGYYKTWRYECNLKKNKVRIYKPNGKSWFMAEANYLKALFQYAANSKEEIPVEIISPSGADINNFCK